MTASQWRAVLIGSAMAGVGLGLWLHAPGQAPSAIGSSARPAAQPRSDAGTSAPFPAGDGGAPRALAVPVQASEPELTTQARIVLSDDPEYALALLAQADQLFGSEHEQRRMLEIHALVKLARIGAAHAKADAFYRRFPESPLQAQIERLTGYHPRPHRRPSVQPAASERRLPEH
jgi:hypothetical protein